MFHDWRNNINTIQGTNIVRTTPITKKLGTPTKCPKVLICYNFHSGIYDEKEDLMFATKPRLFSIGTIAIPTSIWSHQPINLITSASLNLVEQVIKHIELVSQQPISYDIPVKSIPIQPIKIFIPPILSNNIFQRCFSNLK
jgi:hypothetical protein